jgi:hypothetical protein
MLTCDMLRVVNYSMPTDKEKNDKDNDACA